MDTSTKSADNVDTSTKSADNMDTSTKSQEKTEEDGKFLENKHTGSNVGTIKKNSTSKKISNLKQLLRLPEFREVLNSSGQVAAPSSEVFNKLSSALDKANFMTPKYIYTVILGNRYSVYTELTELLNIEVPFQDSVISNDSTLQLGNSEFRLNVTEIWPSMQPQNELHKFKNRDRTIRKLRKNSWTHVLFEEIQHHTNIPCALSFKDSKVTETGIFVTVTATCPECPCQFFGKIVNEPEEGHSVFMECTIENFDPSVVHTKKRHLQGKLRSAVGNFIVERNLLPSQHRRNEAHRLIQTVGEDSPPQLSKSDVLSKVKQESLNKKLGICTSNVMDGLYVLKYNETKYEGAIRNIGLDPPFVYYWTKEQQLLFEKFPTTLYLDGTGSVVKPIKLPNGKVCSHIYLYQAMGDVNGKSVPVFQMLSSSQNTVSILSWLLEFRRIGCIENKNYPFPKETITDFDKALLGALARAFVQVKSLSYYLCLCFEIITGTDVEIPDCILRLDVCHFTQMIARWKCYPKNQPGVRTIYLRAMCLLRRQEDFVEFEKLARAILTLALCRSGKKNSLADKAKQFLRAKIKGISDEIVENVLGNTEEFETLEEINMEFENEEETESSSLQEWVQNMYDNIKNEADCENVADDDDINGYKLPAFALKVKTLLFYFPIFTEILRKKRNFGAINPTSAPVESYFNDLKHRSFKIVGLPLRADKFVAIHILEIIKKLKEAATGSLTVTEDGEIEGVTKPEVKRRKLNDVKFIQEFPEDANELNYEHDWRKKNTKNPFMKPETSTSTVEKSFEDSPEFVDEDSDVPLQEVIDFRNLQKSKTKKRKRNGAQYGEICPQFEPSCTKLTWLPILPNANHCKNIRERTSITIIKNTCAFDSLVLILGMLILNNFFYKKEINDTVGILYSFVKLFITKKRCQEVFKERAKILLDANVTKSEISEYCKNKVKQIFFRTITIDALCNITELAIYLFSGSPSYIVKYTCTSCAQCTSETFVVAPINLNVISSLGISNLKNALLLPITKSKLCCSRTLLTKSHYGAHLLFSVEIGKNNEIEICNIPQNITIEEGVNYKIAGFVAYQGNYNPRSPGHYLAYVYVGNSWLKYDDLSSSETPQQIDVTDVVDPHFFFYVKQDV